jgi:hypothetical protein
MVWSKTIDFYALSRCMGRKCTWMLAKIKYRKSQLYIKSLGEGQNVRLP